MISAGKKPLLGLISTRGSIVAWIKLGDLPSNQGRIFSIAGESQGGNDLDLQIQGNNQLCFFTDGGSATCSANLFTTADIGVWHLITATFKAGGTRALYVDGKLVGTSTAGGHGANQSPFYVGESPVFTGRYFRRQRCGCGDLQGDFDPQGCSHTLAIPERLGESPRA